VLIPGERYLRSWSGVEGISAGVEMGGRVEEVSRGRSSKDGSAKRRVAKSEARRSRVEVLLSFLRNSIPTLLVNFSMVLAKDGVVKEAGELEGGGAVTGEVELGGGAVGSGGGRKVMVGRG